MPKKKKKEQTEQSKTKTFEKTKLNFKNTNKRRDKGSKSL